MKALFFLILVLITSAAIQAEIYTWKDVQGRTHFGDRPPANSKAQPLELEINTIHRPQLQALDAGFSASRQVILYTAEWCGVCRQAKQHFKANNIPFRAYDVEKSAKGRRDYRKLKGTGVPIILVGKQRMNGFSASRFDQLYRQPR